MIHENLGVTTVRTTLIAPTFLELARSYWFDASEVDTSVLFEMSLEVWVTSMSWRSLVQEAGG